MTKNLLKRRPILILGLSLLALWLTFPIITAEEFLTEITVTGTVKVQADPDQMYRNALIDAFQKAYLKVHPATLGDPAADVSSKTDLAALQTELEISDYQILRYWRENGLFFLELKLFFGNSKLQAPRTGDLSQITRLSWTYQATDQVVSVVKAKSAIAVNTTQSIIVLDPDTGKRLQEQKVGLKLHDVNGDRYMVQEGEHLKIASLTQFNLFRLVYTWRQKLPEMSKYYLTKNTFYLIEKNGMVKALNWEDGSVKWQLPAGSRVEISEINVNRLLFIFPTAELWLVDPKQGEKLWAVKFEAPFLASPVASGEAIYCPLKNGQLKVIDRESGRIISAWAIDFENNPINVSLELSEKDLFLAYNDRAGNGHLKAYHRLTGEMLWEANWNEAVSGSLARLANFLVIGTGNTFEARELTFGLKQWEEPVYGRITRIYNIDENLVIVAGNRIYYYQFK
ncbi:MAG: PQQ-binding-like beta-propeller repeat protein [Firmicutes bacterium]|nr:PQQ-binding-like beta-propeller repeat protein [Bacillota bacterium]